jgi:hypothetical protein
MPYQVTDRTCEILQDLHRLAAEQGRYLLLASSSAQLEWKEFQLGWPSDIELAQGTIALSEEHLEAITAKVRRFGEILRGLGTLPGRRAAMFPSKPAEPTDGTHPAALKLQCSGEGLDAQVIGDISHTSRSTHGPKDDVPLKRHPDGLGDLCVCLLGCSWELYG